jgi:hypothetical protein
MVKRALILAAAAAFSLLGLAPAGASSPTILSMTLTEADGSPFANSPVSVFYWPASPSSSGSFSLRLMGSGTTGSSGTVSIPLDTSMVSDAGDVGGGIPDAFNAIVTGFDSSGHVIWQREVITENAATATTASVLTDPATGAPVVASGAPPQCSPTGSVTADLIATHYRYVRVLAENSGAGMSTQLAYTYNSSTARQTVIDSAVSANGASWGVGGGVLGETNSGVTAYWREKGIYHDYVWASYMFAEYKSTSCSCGGCTTVYEWVPDHFEGSVTDNNPNTWKDGSTIGVVKYTVPPFTYCGGQGTCWFTLTPSNSGFSRSPATRQDYSSELSFAGFLSVKEQATGSIARQTWWYQPSGCSAPNSRIIWGDNADPASAAIVQADCIDPYSY